MSLNPSAEMAIREKERVDEKMPTYVGLKTDPVRKAPRAVVDLEKEMAVQVLYSTIIFRPNQEIKDPRLLEIAKENGVPLRYK